MDVDVYAVEEMLLFNMNLLKTCVLLEVVSYESIYIRTVSPHHVHSTKSLCSHSAIVMKAFQEATSCL